MKTNKNLIISSVLGMFISPFVLAGPAVNIDINGNCNVIDGLGNVVSTQSGTVTATLNSQGNTLIKCENVPVTPSPDGTAVKWNFENTGLLCNNLGVGGFQSTHRWSSQVDASGKSRLICHFPDDPGQP